MVKIPMVFDLILAGIVQGQGKVVKVHQQQDFRSIKVQFPSGKMDGIKIGASVAINGTCLTVILPLHQCRTYGCCGGLIL
jgi:riboflavin synthase alpha subunit